MVNNNDIQTFGRLIGREFNPQRVILFGSYAQGRPDRDSDVDLLVIMPHEGPGWKLAACIRDKVKPTFPVDILVRSPEEISSRIALGDAFLREITEHGKVLYEASGYRMDG